MALAEHPDTFRAPPGLSLHERDTLEEDCARIQRELCQLGKHLTHLKRDIEKARRESLMSELWGAYMRGQPQSVREIARQLSNTSSGTKDCSYWQLWTQPDMEELVSLHKQPGQMGGLRAIEIDLDAAQLAIRERFPPLGMPTHGEIQFASNDLSGLVTKIGEDGQASNIGGLVCSTRNLVGASQYAVFQQA